VHLGQAIDVSLSDVLDHLAADAATRAIVFQFESVGAAREFMSAATRRGAQQAGAGAAHRPQRRPASARGDDAPASRSRATRSTTPRLPPRRRRACRVARRPVRRARGDRAWPLGARRPLAIVSNGAGIGRLATDVC
jgi:acetyltransferase